MDIADDASVLDHGVDDFMDITTINPSDKPFDTIINLVNGYYLDEAGGNDTTSTLDVDILKDGVNI